ncbi:MAG: hypothetical protein KBT88_16180 [Gammaproteobacteria bacterium]|nr:hypothetical protein [Gammaproteobacteria bacterium]MBQ0841321.1 hypothetical protein [Gammaproteobacteria bacterium]
MSDRQFKVPTKPFQGAIRLAYKLEGPGASDTSSSPERNQLILELLGVTPADAEKLYGSKDAVPDSSGIELVPKRVHKLKKPSGEPPDEQTDECPPSNPADKKSSAECTEKKADDLSETGDSIPEVSDEISTSKLVSKEFLSWFRDMWGWHLQHTEDNCWVSSETIEWSEEPAEGGGRQFSCVGTEALHQKLLGILRQEDDDYQTVLVGFPLPTNPEGLCENYTWYFLESSHDIEFGQDSAVAVLIALQLLNEGGYNAKMQDIVENTQLSDYFYSLPRQDGKNEAFIFVSGEVEMGACAGEEGDLVEGELFRVRSREGNNTHAVKKLYTDTVKRKEDIHHVAFNLAFMAGQTNGLIFELKLPKLKLGEGEGEGEDEGTSPPPDISVYAPRFWTQAITPTKGTIKAGAWGLYAREDFAKAYNKARDPDNTEPIYCYDLILPDHH